jgi:Ser/Thr protein kinase RdoA (MazF antagonist)
MYSNSELNTVTGLFGLNPSGFHELTYGSKWMGRRYAVTTATSKFFLKIRSEWWPVEQAEYVCDLLQDLHSRGFPVPDLHLTTEGEPFAQWEGHICECYQFIEGQLLAPGSPNQNYVAGQTLCCLHSLTNTYPSPGVHLPEGCGFPWPTHVEFFVNRLRNLFAGQAKAMATLERVLDALMTLEADNRPHQDSGLVHGDYHPGNLILRDGRIVAVCDFDLVQHAPRVYDKAYFLYRTAGRHSLSDGGIVRLDREVAQAFLDGYQSECRGTPASMSRAEIGHELLRFAWYDCLLEANNTGDQQKLEEWSSDTAALGSDVEQWVRR